ncbi:unnamed protein product [Closterium sp. Naga37s-1]|nr:unnamed protein product [Closterium sp. Naga37s-1]
MNPYPQVCEEGPEHRAMVRKGPEGTEVHTLLMEGIVNGPVEAAVAMTRDVTFFKEWWPQQNMPVYKVIENRYLKRIGDGFDLTYMSLLTVTNFSFVPHQPPEDSTLINPAKHGFPRDAVPPAPSGVVRMAINGGFTVKDLGENRCHYRGIFTVDLKMPPALVNFVTKGFGGMLFTVFSKEIESDLADTKGSKGRAFRKVLKEEQLYVRISEAMREHRARKEKRQERDGRGGAAAAAVATAAATGEDGEEGEEEEEEWDGGNSEAFYSPASSFSSFFHAHSLPPLSLDHALATESLNPHATGGMQLRDAPQVFSQTRGTNRRTSAPPRCRSSVPRGGRMIGSAAAEVEEAETGGAAGWVGRGRFGFRSSRRKAEERARRLTEAIPSFSSSLHTPSSPATSLASSLSQARLEDLGLIPVIPVSPVDSAHTSAHEAASYRPHHSDLCQQMQPGDFDRIVAGGASESKGVFGSSGKGNGDVGGKTGGGLTSRRGSTGSTGSVGSVGMTGSGSSAGSSSSSWSASPVLWEERRVSEAGNRGPAGAGGTTAGALSPGWDSGSTHSSRSSSSRGSSNVRTRGASSPSHGQVKEQPSGAPGGKGFGRYCDAMPKQQVEVKRRQATERRFLNFLKGGREIDFGAS